MLLIIYCPSFVINFLLAGSVQISYGIVDAWLQVGTLFLRMPAFTRFFPNVSTIKRKPSSNEFCFMQWVLIGSLCVFVRN